MREIEFRAWDDEEKRMFERVGVEPLRVILFDHSGDSKMMPPVEIGYIGIDCDDLFLEQFTGLRDKNGRKIYEGDVVLFSRTIDGEMLKTKSEVKIEQDGSASFAHTPQPTSGLVVWLSLGQHLYQVEIVGNIHENPELLK